MTSIGGFPHAASPTNQLLPPRLAVGQTVEVNVLGVSRHGVSIQLGQERLQLDVPSRLADARTLTLEGTASSSAEGQRVRVVAGDGRPLVQPLEANLIAKAKPSPPNAGDTVHKNEIKVVAQPVNPDGKVRGPSVTLHLQATPPQAAAKTTAAQTGQSSPAQTVPPTPQSVENRPAATPDAPSRTSTAVDPQNGSTSSSVRQSGANATHQGRPDGGLPQTVTQHVGSAQKTGPMRAAPSTSAVSANSRPMLNNSQAVPTQVGADAQQMHGDRATPHQSAPATTRSADVEPTAIKGRDASGVTTSQSAASRETPPQSRPPMQAASPALPQAAVDRKMPPIVTVPTTVTSLANPTASTNATAPMTATTSVTATVVGQSDAGKVILKAADQHFRIEQQVNLPLGMTLQATLASSSSALAMPLDPGAGGDSATPLTKLIELLDDIDRAGRHTAEAGQSSLARQLPAPDKHLASKFLGLLAMLDGQTPEGKSSPSLKQGGLTSGQRDQIQGMVRELGTMASEPLADGWKGLTLPLGSDLGQAVSLFFRDHGLDPDDEGQDGDAEQAETKRAVFDVSLSQLGRCQIDALCQNQRFDLLIRSERPFTQKDQQDIAALFVSASEIAGMNGEIGFKIGSFFEPARSAASTKAVQT